MSLILCSGYCEHGKFMGECLECAEAELEDAVTEDSEKND